MNLPIAFEDRMRELLGEEYEEYLQCYSQPHYSGIRVNTLKISPEEFERSCPFSIKRIPWIRNGYYYDSKEQPARHPYYYAGLYYIQEPSAMTPASLLPIEEGDKVLDICAAPGGKSTELGARLKGTGLLVSNDISNSRAKALLKNIELFGIRNALVLSEAPNKLVEYFPKYFDKILIDAPCSGEGMFRKSPAIMRNWEQYGVGYYNKLQKEIILLAAKMLKPGGMMLYSTCTFSPEEDEGTISYLLEQCPEFHVAGALADEKTQEELGISYDGFDFGRPEWVNNGREELRGCIRLWPHKIKGEGHFIALLKKEDKREIAADHAPVYSCSTRKNMDTLSGNVDTLLRGMDTLPEGIDALSGGRNTLSGGRNTLSGGRNVLPKDRILLSAEALEFMQKLGENKIDGSGEAINDRFPRGQLTVREDRVYLSPKGLPELKGLRILRQGLLIGEMKKQRFEPSQALANSLSKREYDKIIDLDSSDPKVIRYLKCETLEPETGLDDGWYLICVDGFPLGWSKIVKNNFKNKYLPGWRWV